MCPPRHHWKVRGVLGHLPPASLNWGEAYAPAPTSTPGHTHGRSPELAARVQPLRELQARLQARLRDHVDPTYGEVTEAVDCAIDEVMDPLDTAGAGCQ